MDSSWNGLMTRAIELAGRGAGEVEPNPRVGALALAGEQVLGEGWHGWWGGPHAEPQALAAAREKQVLVDTVVVTLEPCCTRGKTGPCTEALLAAGVKRVICGATDPNPLHAGKGLAILRQAGVEVISDVMAPECLAAAGPFTTWIGETRPWVIAKWAMSLDGRIATRTGSSRWITPKELRVLSHRLRSRVDAVMVGLGTVEADDPALDLRHVPGPNPLALVIDPAGRIPLTSRLVQGAKERQLIVITESGACPIDRGQALVAAGVDLYSAPAPLALPDVLTWLRVERGVSRLLLEGGSTLHGLFRDQGLVDQLEMHLGPLVIGGQEALGPVGGTGPEEIGLAVDFDILSATPVGRGIRIVALPTGEINQC